MLRKIDARFRNRGLMSFSERDNFNAIILEIALSKMGSVDSGAPKL